MSESSSTTFSANTTSTATTTTAASLLSTSATTAATASTATTTTSSTTTTPGTNAGFAQVVAQLEDFDPVIPDVVTSHYLSHAGFECADPRVVRLVSLSAQKFISDVAIDALQQYRVRQSAINKKQRQDKRATLTLEDLTPALAEYGITLKKPPYFT